MITISLEGIQSFDGVSEERALALLKVIKDENVYHWKIYVPLNITDLSAFLEESKISIENDINKKELIWQELDPKTKPYENPFTGEVSNIPILKEDIVKPDIPDYYANRRSKYPKLADQLDALWKGIGSEEYYTIFDLIQSVKNTNPKPTAVDDPIEQQNLLLQHITNETQKRLDFFARTRGYDNIMSASTYESSPVEKFRVEGLYCVTVRSQTWAKLYEILDEVKTGIRPMPSSFLDIQGELPPLIWPN